MAITAEILIKSRVIFCCIFRFSRIFRAASAASFPGSAPYRRSSPMESRSERGGMIRIAPAISPSREHPPARYRSFPETARGSATEIPNSTAPTATTRRREGGASSTAPAITSRRGRRLARRTGIQADSSETRTATARETPIPSEEITTGISIPRPKDAPIPRRINFSAGSPRRIPAAPPKLP